MKQKDKKVEDFWDDLDVRKRDDDRELQRKTVLGADAVVNSVARAFWKVVRIVLLILLGLRLLGICMSERQKHFANPYEKPDYSTDLGFGHH